MTQEAFSTAFLTLALMVHKSMQFEENSKHLNKHLDPHRLHDSLVSYLFVGEAWHCVDVLFLYHESRQVGGVRSQKDDSKKGPDQNHDFTGGSFGVFNGDGVVEDNAPQKPHRFSNCEGWSAWSWEQREMSYTFQRNCPDFHGGFHGRLEKDFFVGSDLI